ncbi:unnamed protein product, partial [Coccothraustes coccothraustes]
FPDPPSTCLMHRARQVNKDGNSSFVMPTAPSLLFHGQPRVPGTPERQERGALL